MRFLFYVYVYSVAKMWFAIPFGLLNSLFSSLCYLETVSIRYAFVFLFCFALLVKNQIFE